jgi:hypothetical protein
MVTAWNIYSETSILWSWFYISREFTHFVHGPTQMLIAVILNF